MHTATRQDPTGRTTTTARYKDPEAAHRQAAAWAGSGWTGVVTDGKRTWTYKAKPTEALETRYDY